MFTNAKVITVFHKTIDAEKRLPKWEKHLFYDIYWENCSSQSEKGTEMNESDLIFCVIPEKSINDFIPCKDDLIAKGNFENISNPEICRHFTIMSVKDFRYGSGRVHHMEVNAK